MKYKCSYCKIKMKKIGVNMYACTKCKQDGYLVLYWPKQKEPLQSCDILKEKERYE